MIVISLATSTRFSCVNCVMLEASSGSRGGLVWMSREGSLSQSYASVLLLVVGRPLFEIQTERVSMCHQSLSQPSTSGKPQAKVQRCSG